MQHGAHDFLVDVRLFEIGQKAAVDLQPVDGHALQGGDVGIAGAEIVKRHPHPGIGEPQQLAKRHCEVGNDQLFGDLQHQGLGPEPMGPCGLQHAVAETRPAELAWRHVDGDIVQPAFRHQPPDIGSRAGEHPVEQRIHQMRLFGKLDEMRGPEQATFGMLPARQRLDAANAPARRVDDRLVPGDDFA